MMAQQTDRHNIADDLYLLKTTDSKKWIARMKINGKWLQTSTKTADKNEAIHKAFVIKTQKQTLADQNLPYQQTSNRHSFKAIAEAAIKLMLDSNGQPKERKYRDYILALNNYHIPFFDKTHIREIDQKKLEEFDTWRENKMGKPPAKSTINNHNAALNLVFDKAIEDGIITALSKPKLKNKGSKAERRAHFTREEFSQLLQSKFWNKGKTNKTKQTRQLLKQYAVFAVSTGVRPGTEMDNIKWGDIKPINKDGKQYSTAIITKGKTTKHTGARQVILQKAAVLALNALRTMNRHTGENDYIFRLPDGGKSNELGRNFTLLLKEENMHESPLGKRTLYSLRHSYITWLIMDNVPLTTIAAQCGTSVEMIEKHYSHLTAIDKATELYGSTDSTLVLNDSVMDQLLK